MKPHMGGYTRGAAAKTCGKAMEDAVPDTSTDTAGSKGKRFEGSFLHASTKT